MASFKKVKGKQLSARTTEADLIDSVRKVLTNAGGQHARLHERPVRQWGSAPGFIPIVFDPANGHMRLEVWVTGSNKDRMKWHSMNEGQALRVITAKGKDMVYRPGYKASTKRRRLTSKERSRYGKKRRARQVVHSQEAREIGPTVNGIINERVDRWMRRAVWASFKRTL